jgi:hypothetical protein
MAPWKFAWPELDFAPHASPEIEAMLKAAPVLPFDERESAAAAVQVLRVLHERDSAGSRGR